MKIAVLLKSGPCTDNAERALQTASEMLHTIPWSLCWKLVTVLSGFFEKSGENTCADRGRLTVFLLYFIPANDPDFYTRRWTA